MPLAKTDPSFDPVLLSTFVAAAQSRSFTKAGRRLGIRQSTVRQHIRRLEAAAARRVFVRDTHSVALTPDGDAMPGFAQSIIEANARARRSPATRPVTPRSLVAVRHG